MTDRNTHWHPARDGPALLREYARTRDTALRNRLVELHQPLVWSIALRFAPSGGNALEDLVQVGSVGLISAVERYRPESGSAFLTFATPTIVGVIKHHLRDTGWMVKAPRRLRELGVRLRRVRRELEQRLGRQPSVREVAEAAGEAEERVLEAMEIDSLRVASLEAPAVERDGSPAARRDVFGRTDPHLCAIEDREWVLSALGHLDEGERVVIYQRFFDEVSQAEVARRLGVSQMRVSRLERRAIGRLRALLAA